MWRRQAKDVKMVCDIHNVVYPNQKINPKNAIAFCQNMAKNCEKKGD